MSDLFHNPLLLVPISVFVGGLIGSPHCMMMCGPIVLNFANDRKRLVAYQLGRMIGYTTAGAVVGALGNEILSGLNTCWVSTFSIFFIAILLIVNGYRAFLGRPLHLPMPKFLSKLSSRLWLHIRTSKLPKFFSSALAGLFTVFLPCGHLYGFLLGAVATGSAGRGAAFMFAFWLGSTPLLSVSGTVLQKILQTKMINGQRLAGALLVLAGVISVAAFGFRAQSSHEHQTHQHEAASEETARSSTPHCH